MGSHSLLQTGQATWLPGLPRKERPCLACGSGDELAGRGGDSDEKEGERMKDSGGRNADRGRSPDCRSHTTFSLLSLTFSSVNGICSGVCAPKGNVTGDNGAESGTGLSGLKPQLCHSRAM